MSGGLRVHVVGDDVTTTGTLYFGITLNIAPIGDVQHFSHKYIHALLIFKFEDKFEY